MSAPYTFIILTFNEERRLIDCLDSLRDVDAPVFVVDSFSTDGTLGILADRRIPFVQHEFQNYAAQRNWAQEHNPFGTEWLFHLDADERLSEELRSWLKHEFNRAAPECDGFMFSRRTVFMGRWIRFGGHYPAYHMRLFRANRGRCEIKAYDQHFVAAGRLRVVPNTDIIDTVTASLSDFTASHNKWSSIEASESLEGINTGEVVPRLGGTPIERRRWAKTTLYVNAPIFWRAFAYFAYRYIIRGGFLDGREGLIFHFLQGLWFRFLIDAKICEKRAESAASSRRR